MISKQGKILVTGGHGFLGSCLIRRLEKAGYSNISTFGSKDYDITLRSETCKVLAMENPEVVIHLAARVGGIGANEQNPAVFAFSNLAMGTNIVDCSHKYGVKKLIIAGTVCAYPKFTPVPFKESDLWNGYPEETNAPYGLAKKMLLVLSQAYRKQYGFNSIFLLPANLYGNRDNFDLMSSHVIPAMIRKFHEAKEQGIDVTLWGDGSASREFLYVEDCAEAFIAAMERYDEEPPINIGNGNEIKIGDLALKIQKTVGHEGRIIWDTSRPNGQPRRGLDVSLAKDKLGWEASTNIDVGLQKTYEWFLLNKGE